jgi:hypothetical protein
MIFCKTCGGNNPIGTMFCLTCGCQLEITPEDIKRSVQATNKNEAADLAFGAARTWCSLAGFLFFASLFFYIILVPTPKSPPPMPVPSRMDTAQIFAPTSAWSGKIVAPNAEQNIPKTTSFSLVEWRKEQWDAALGSVELNVTNITNWQVEILNAQGKEDGSWSKGATDKVAATALMVLALQAYPVIKEIHQRVPKGLEFLRPILRDNGASVSPLARTLAFMALLESGTLTDSQIRSVSLQNASGDEPRWQCLALLTLPAEFRPPRIAALRGKITDPIWKHLLDPFSDKAMITEVNSELFSEAGLASLSPLDRIAWAHTAWRLGINPILFKRTVEEWSKAEVPARADADLRQAVGPLADRALAILACTAQLRAPSGWWKDLRDSPP